MATHKLSVTLPYGPPDIGADIDVEITFRHSYLLPPTRVCPGYGDIIEFISTTSGPDYGDAFDDLRQVALDDFVSDWLAEDGYAVAAEKARADREGERERAGDAAPLFDNPSGL